MTTITNRYIRFEIPNGDGGYDTAEQIANESAIPRIGEMVMLPSEDIYRYVVSVLNAYMTMGRGSEEVMHVIIIRLSHQ